MFFAQKLGPAPPNAVAYALRNLLVTRLNGRRSIKDDEVKKLTETFLKTSGPEAERFKAQQVIDEAVKMGLLIKKGREFEVV